MYTNGTSPEQCNVLCPLIKGVHKLSTTIFNNEEWAINEQRILGNYLRIKRTIKTKKNSSQTFFPKDANMVESLQLDDCSIKAFLGQQTFI